jgi:hypothetical protein
MVCAMLVDLLLPIRVHEGAASLCGGPHPAVCAERSQGVPVCPGFLLASRAISQPASPTGGAGSWTVASIALMATRELR